jgi:hypothetical protein
MDAAKEDCLSLNKTIYFLLQSASQFYIKLVEAQTLWFQKSVKWIHACGQSMVHLD